MEKNKSIKDLIFALEFAADNVESAKQTLNEKKSEYSDIKENLMNRIGEFDTANKEQLLKEGKHIYEFEYRELIITVDEGCVVDIEIFKPIVLKKYSSTEEDTEAEAL